jgi:uncharacterized ferritin-like protein (DUF455 family)
VGDLKMMSILEKVLADEIGHVELGIKYLTKKNTNQVSTQNDLWTYYQTLLPYPLTPARSKGISFQRELRFKAHMPLSFVNSLEKFQDNFKVTSRKS